MSGKRVMVMFWHYYKDQVLEKLQTLGFAANVLDGPLKGIMLTRGTIPEENLAKANEIPGVIRPIEPDNRQ